MDLHQSQKHYKEVKRYEPHPRFEHRSPIPFPITITFTLITLPNLLRFTCLTIKENELREAHYTHTCCYLVVT